MENKRQNIVLSEKFLKQINSRASIYAVVSKLKRNKHYSIDFKNIDFISRAVAHELVSFKSILLDRRIDVTYINVPLNINMMIQKVEESTMLQRNPSSKKKELSSDIMFWKWDGLHSKP